MEEELRRALRKIGDIYASASDLKSSTVWARAVGDARFIERIESGKGFTVKTYDAAMEWFSDNWPDGAEWPTDVSRSVTPNDFLPPAPASDYAPSSQDATEAEAAE